MSTERQPGDLDSDWAAVSGDGQYVVFHSQASNLVPGYNGVASEGDLFIRNRWTGTTLPLRPGANGTRPSITPDGRYVTFTTKSRLVASDQGSWGDLYLFDRQTSVTELVSISRTGGEGKSFSYGSLTPDGRYVVFFSEGSDIVSGDTNGERDVFIRDRQTQTTELVSVSSTGAQGDGCSMVCGSGAVSSDGRYVAFSSYATNLVAGGSSGSGHAYVRDRTAGTTEIIDTPNGAASDMRRVIISADGRYAAFDSLDSGLVPNDTNGVRDIFVRDRQTGSLTRVNVGNEGQEADGETSFSYTMSADGRYVVFESVADNLVPGDIGGHADVFLRDLAAGTTIRISQASNGLEANSGSSSDPYGPSISGDGRYIAFASWAANLVPGGTDEHRDVFLWDRDGLSDVPLNYWAYSFILACFNADIVRGHSDGSYGSSGPVSRDQMAVYVSRAVAGGDAAIPAAPLTASFSDVPLGHWAFRYVEYARAQNIVQGLSDGTYGPAITLDRGQMAVFIARALTDPLYRPDLSNYVAPTTPHFPDVSAAHWAYKYIEYIADPSRGVTQGCSDGRYHPEYQCSRDQMAVYVARAFKLPM